MLHTTLSQVCAVILLATQLSHALTSSSPLNLITRPSVPATCRGSFWCPKFNTPSNRINLYLENWIRYGISDADVYGPGAQIACATVTILLPPLGTNAYCAYTRDAFVPPAGINGSVIKQRMEDLRSQGCFACGYVPIAESGVTSDGGMFIIDYVPKNQVRCGRPGDVVCPPTKPAEDREGLEEDERPALREFNATFDDGTVTLQALNVQDI